MKQQQFIDQQRPSWDKFKDLLEQMTGPRRRRDAEALVELPELYRSICADYALARRRQYSTGLVDELHALVMRGHGVLYRRKSIWFWRIVSFLWIDFPVTLRRHIRFFWLATVLLYLPAVVIGGLAYKDDKIIHSLMSPVEVAGMEFMYDPSNPHLWREVKRAASTNFAMFGYYIYNNIGIGFRTFATGLLGGVGAVVALFYNGSVFGAVAGHLTQLGFINTFWPFVAGHGAFELTAICICGAAGLLLGWSLIAAGRRRRIDALITAAGEAVKLVMGAGTMLLIAAFVEAFWSSSDGVGEMTKYFVAAVFWSLVILYLTFAGRNQHAA